MKYSLLFLLYISIAFSSAASERLDTTGYKCVYRVNYMSDTVTKTYGNKDLYILQISDQLSKGYSYSKFHLDSLMSSRSGMLEFAKIFTKSLKDANSLYGTNLMFAKVYKDYKQKKITVTDHISIYEYLYEEQLQPQDWKVLNDTATILGYHCLKAICNFRGRAYEAWFAPGIHLAEGPWKFGGLPGLIMKLEDTRQQYRFELVSFTTTNEPINADINQWATKIERIQFLGYLMGEKAAEIKNADPVGVLLPAVEQKKNLDYIERDYK